MSDLMQKNELENSAPPFSNRGVQNTYRGDLRACVDWLQATLTFFTDYEIFCDLLGVDKCKFTLQERGLYGYRTHYKYGHISILADGAETMGIHLQMTGQACREYESLNIKTWKQLLYDIRELKGTFTRIDVAIDDIIRHDQKHYFDINKLVSKVKAAATKTYFKKVRIVETVLTATGETKGQTLYVGQDSSDIQIRFYDKGQERIAKGLELEEGVIGWIRTEVQTRRKRADILANYLIFEDYIGDVVAGVLKNYINFLIPSNDANKARWKVCSWWDDFLGDVSKLKLTLIAPDRTIERTKAWIDKQIAPSLGMLYMAFGGSEEILATTIADGVMRLTDTQLQLAKEYQEMMIEDKKYIEHIKKTKYNEYLFRSGVHREEYKKDTASNSVQSIDN